MNLTKPSEYLYLSWSKVSGDGKSLRPAYLIADVRRIFPALTVVDEEKRRMPEHEITEKTGLIKVAEGIRDRQLGISDEWKELYTWFRRERRSGKEVKQILDAGFLTRKYPELEPEQAKKLYPDPERISVTRMEQFASCAYAHFLSYGLRLSDREEYEFEAMDLGNIAHQSLERFSRKADREKMRWEELPEELRDELIDESVEESVLDYGNTVIVQLCEE